MSKRILPYIIIISAILSACRDIDEPLMPDVTDRDIISLSVTDVVNVKSVGASSRATDDGMYTHFEQGDAVGLIILDKAGNFIVNNAEFVLDSNGWTYRGDDENPLYYDSEVYKYIVYFPYDESVTKAECRSAEELLNWPTFERKEDQVNKHDFRFSDLMVWTSEGEPIKKINAKLNHMRSCVSLDIDVKWKLRTMDPALITEGNFIDYSKDIFNEEDSKDDNSGDENSEDYEPEKPLDLREVITFKIPNEIAVFDEEGKQLKLHQADDGTFRYILPDHYEGDITYYYNYRESLFKGSFHIKAEERGTRYSKYETVDYGVYKYKDVLVGDFYCKNSKNYGFVLPHEATGYLDDDNHRCIGLVFYTGQHENDGMQNGPYQHYSYNYINTNIGAESCHGYVLALTDVHNDYNDLLEWELNDDYTPFGGMDSRRWVSTTNVDLEDWGGYYNTDEILRICENKDKVLNKNWYPAFYGAYYYGNLVSGTVEVTKKNGEKVQKLILFNNREGHADTPSGGHPDEHNVYAWQASLQAPVNTSGWILPGCGQLREFAQHKDLFEQRYEEIKEKLADDVPYKDHIRWFLHERGYRAKPFYWTSTYYPTLVNGIEFLGDAFAMEFSGAYWTKSNEKYNRFGVRAVLAY